MTDAEKIELLASRRELFAGFLAKRLGGNRADAEDVLQQCLARSVGALGGLRDDERITSWFLSVLRHAATDHVRSRRAGAAREQQWLREEIVLGGDEESDRALCSCVEGLIDTLPLIQAELLRRIELNNQPVGATAQELGMTANAASVALHRGRTALHAKLIAFCGDCSAGSCLDCDCEKNE